MRPERAAAPGPEPGSSTQDAHPPRQPVTPTVSPWADFARDLVAEVDAAARFSYCDCDDDVDLCACHYRVRLRDLAVEARRQLWLIELDGRRS